VVLQENSYGNFFGTLWEGLGMTPVVYIEKRHWTGDFDPVYGLHIFELRPHLGSGPQPVSGEHISLANPEVGGTETRPHRLAMHGPFLTL
jgi:hypothetical protein